MSGPLRWILPEQLLEKCQTQQNRPLVFKLGPGDQQGHLNGLSGVRQKFLRQNPLKSGGLWFNVHQFLGGLDRKTLGTCVLDYTYVLCNFFILQIYHSVKHFELLLSETMLLVFHKLTVDY